MLRSRRTHVLAALALLGTARRRSSVGVVPNFWRSTSQSPSTSTTASIFLWTSIPAIWYGIGCNQLRKSSSAASHQIKDLPSPHP
jgi:hypothetical protein